MKPNPENDNYFFDDEPKDWKEICWHPNKVVLGKAKEVKFKDDLLEDQLIEDFADDELQKKIEFIAESSAKTEISALLPTIPEYEKFTDIVSDYETHAGYLNNMRNFIRALGLMNIP